MAKKANLVGEQPLLGRPSWGEKVDYKKLAGFPSELDKMEQKSMKSAKSNKSNKSAKKKKN